MADPKVVRVECITAYDPPMFLLIFLDSYALLVPYGAYQDLKGPLGLSDDPCSVTGPGV